MASSVSIRAAAAASENEQGQEHPADGLPRSARPGCDVAARAAVVAARVVLARVVNSTGYGLARAWGSVSGRVAEVRGTTPLGPAVVARGLVVPGLAVPGLLVPGAVGNNAPGPDSFRDAPWLWLSIAGLTLVIVTLLATPIVLRESGNPGTYIAPQYKDGKILPGHYDKK